MPKWLSNNWVIGPVFAVLLVINAYAITAGWYR
jgi:hypothetical protein